MRSVLITGINGFIGKHIATAFLNAGFQVCGIDLKAGVFDPRINCAACDLTDKKETAKALQDMEFDCVVHLAASLVMNDQRTLEINTLATYNALQSAKERHCTSFLHLSSIPIIGLPPLEGMISEETPANPRTLYHVSKYAAEQLLMLPEFSSMRRCNFRIASPIGPGMPHSFLKHMLTAAVTGAPLAVYGTGSRIQNYIDARDVAHAFVLAEEQHPKDGLYLIGGTSCSNIAAAKLCAELAGCGSEVIFADKADVSDGEQWFIDSTKIKHSLGFEPKYSLEHSLRDVLEADF